MATDTPNTELAEKLLVLCKKMFREFTGVEITLAKELISLEDQLRAITGEEPPQQKKPELPANTPPPPVVNEPPAPKEEPIAASGVGSKIKPPTDDLPF